jgi:2-polyprenyl-3-methyl-5-hydroxy-6-metoxy-1,4-benzoquinol methylase
MLGYGTHARNGVKTDGSIFDDNKMASQVHKSFVKKKFGLPVEKSPVLGECLARLFTDENDLVVEACCGGGSLTAGAAKAGRRVMAFDSNPAYIERAKTMWEEKP